MTCHVTSRYVPHGVCDGARGLLPQEHVTRVPVLGRMFRDEREIPEIIILEKVKL